MAELDPAIPRRAAELKMLFDGIIRRTRDPPPHPDPLRPQRAEREDQVSAFMSSVHSIGLVPVTMAWTKSGEGGRSRICRAGRPVGSRPLPHWRDDDPPVLPALVLDPN